jgi:hypothetical protein
MIGLKMFFIINELDYFYVLSCVNCVYYFKKLDLDPTGQKVR